MWRKNRRMMHQQKQNNKMVVGTEAAAQKNLERNRRDFRYPSAGFVCPVEHSLLYSMLSAPKIYPEDVIKDAIRDEDFDEYLLVNSSSSTTTTQDEQQSEEEHHSYAQLSALLCLASEKYPVPPYDSEAGERDNIKNTVPQILCRRLLQTVVRHAESHQLDREQEVRELLQPLSQLTAKKDVQQTFSILIPTYIGLGASMLTANPLPLYIGWAIGTGSAVSDQDFQNQAGNLQQLQSTTERVADVEKTSLLDEAE